MLSRLWGPLTFLSYEQTSSPSRKPRHCRLLPTPHPHVPPVARSYQISKICDLLLHLYYPWFNLRSFFLSWVNASVCQLPPVPSPSHSFNHSFIHSYDVLWELTCLCAKHIQEMPQGCDLLVTKKTSRLSAILVQRSWGTFRGGVSQADELEVGLGVCTGNVENSMSHPPTS